MHAFLLELIRNLEKRLSKPVEIDGLWVGAGKGETQDKVRTALKLIATHDPRRYSRILKDLKGVWVNLLPGALGQYSAQDDLCELDERFVKSAAPDLVASVIVHEAMHARLWHRGIRYSEDIRLRVETACLRQQEVFAAKLRDPAAVANDVHHRLEVSNADDWSDATMNRRWMHGAFTALRELKVPRWLIAFVLKRRRAQRRRQRSVMPTNGRPRP